MDSILTFIDEAKTVMLSVVALAVGTLAVCQLAAFAWVGLRAAFHNIILFFEDKIVARMSDEEFNRYIGK